MAMLNDYPALKSLVFYATLNVVKMLGMVFLTVKQRFRKGVFANAEDITNSKAKVSFNDADVERVRRNHLNDLENIPAFVLVAFCYCLTQPTLSTALMHFRVFTACRFLHTISYQLPLPQPARALTFFIGFGATISMAVQVLMTFPW